MEESKQVLHEEDVLISKDFGQPLDIEAQLAKMALGIFYFAITFSSLDNTLIHPDNEVSSIDLGFSNFIEESISLGEEAGDMGRYFLDISNINAKECTISISNK